MALALSGHVTTHLATRTTSKDTATPQTYKAPTLKRVSLGLRTVRHMGTQPTFKATQTGTLGTRPFRHCRG